MPKPRKHILLCILLSALLVILIAAGSVSLWLSHHYKQVISEHLPEMVTNGSDSVYHVSYTDISVSIFDRHVTITGLKLWPDKKQVAYLRSQHRRTPPTLSTVSIPLLEAYDITWENLVSKHSLDCKNVIVHNLSWVLDCTPHPGDSSFIRDKKSTPLISSITAAHIDFTNPDITYHFKGPREKFSCFMKGGTVALDQFAYHTDEKIDTSVFLFAKSGQARFQNFTFIKSNGRYTIIKPLLDFTCTPQSVTLKDVKIKHMTDQDPKTGAEKEVYDLSFPSIELTGFNWNKLINHNTLAAETVNANEPHIYIHYIRKNASSDNSKAGAYPNQLLLQVGLQTNFKHINLAAGHFKYIEVTEKKGEATIEFTGIHGHFRNVTNIDSIIKHNKSCIIDLHGKYMGKSDVTAIFTLGLADTTGKFKVDGTVENLDGKDVSDQAAAFTLVKVTSFHLNKMDIHEEGDQTYAKGNFTVLYKDLKVSLFKFNSKHREGKKGTLSFLGDALLYYPSNPMPRKEVRTVTTSFARDTTKGFISLVWENIYRAAKKTAVREKVIITLTDGPETTKGEQPKRGILKRLFGKKK